MKTFTSSVSALLIAAGAILCCLSIDVNGVSIISPSPCASPCSSPYGPEIVLPGPGYSPLLPSYPYPGSVYPVPSAPAVYEYPGSAPAIYEYPASVPAMYPAASPAIYPALAPAPCLPSAPIIASAPAVLPAPSVIPAPVLPLPGISPYYNPILDPCGC